MNRSWMLLGIISSARCTDPPPRPDPCDFDSIECRPPSGFEIDPGCASNEQLEVAIGQGADAFEPVDVPEVHYGSQGGRHLFLAVRVENPDDDHATFQAFLQLEEPSSDAGSTTLTERAVVFSDDDATRQPGGGLDLAGLILVLPDVELSGPGSLVLDARDTCDRRGRSTASFEWP